MKYKIIKTLKILIIIPVIFSFIVSSIMATTFMPVSLEKQLTESDAILEGEFIRKQYKKKYDNEVVTEAFFRIKNIAGIKLSEIINNNEFKITFQGGIWQNVHYHVLGSPDLKVGKKTVVLLNKKADGYWLHNLKLGQYSIKKENGVKYIVSEVFPYHPRFGKIRYEEYQVLVEQVLDTQIISIKDIVNNVIRVQNNLNKQNRQSSKKLKNFKKQNRRIASKQMRDKEPEIKTIYSPALILLSLVIVYFLFLRTRSDIDE
jgi:hypothetical protein